MTQEIRLEFGTFEDKTWTFTLVNFDLSNINLRSEIRTETDILVGEFATEITAINQFTLTITSTVSGLIPPGEYKSDVLARNTQSNKQTFITPVFIVNVVNRVTEPLTLVATP